MNKEIVIGTDLKPLHNSTCMWYFGHASQNKLFYILRSDYATVYIYKDSQEGKEIGEWLSVEKNRKNDRVHEKVLEYLLPRISVEEFVEMLDIEKRLSWDEGYRWARHKIRSALGIE